MPAKQIGLARKDLTLLAVAWPCWVSLVTNTPGLPRLWAPSEEEEIGVHPGLLMLMPTKTYGFEVSRPHRKWALNSEHTTVFSQMSPAASHTQQEKLQLCLNYMEVVDGVDAW